MLTELRNRGLADALIVCCDGLAGLAESIRATWPDATVQTCVVHMVPNSLRYASKKHWGPITKAMREIYTSPTVEAAEARFEAFADDWERTYPAMIRSWRQAWDEFTPFLEFPPELRKVVYTTNAIESLNARFRRAVRHRGHSPQRTSRHESPLPCRHHPTQEPHQPDRPHQRLQSHPEHTDRPLRRPHRRPHPMKTTTAGYTKNPSVTVGLPGLSARGLRSGPARSGCLRGCWVSCCRLGSSMRAAASEMCSGPSRRYRRRAAPHLAGARAAQREAQAAVLELPVHLIKKGRGSLDLVDDDMA